MSDEPDIEPDTAKKIFTENVHKIPPQHLTENGFRYNITCSLSLGSVVARCKCSDKWTLHKVDDLIITCTYISFLYLVTLECPMSSHKLGLEVLMYSCGLHAQCALL